MVRTESTSNAALSPVQQGMVFHQLSIGQHSGVDVEQIVSDLRHSLDEDLFKECWQKLIQSRDVLRSYIDLDASQPRQRVSDNVEIDFAVVDWTDRELDQASIEDDFSEYLADDRRQGFDITKSPLFRIRLIKLSDQWYRCLWTLQHLLIDGRSFGPCLLDLLDLYDQRASGDNVSIRVRPSRDPYLAWRDELDWSGSLNYWKGLLGGISSGTSLRQAVSSDKDEFGLVPRGEVLSAFSTADMQRFQTWASENGVTLNALVQAAWAGLHHRYNGSNTVVFGQTRAGRAGTVADANEMLGVFITTTPVRVDFDTKPALAVVKEIRQQHLSARDHEHTPLAEIQSVTTVPPGRPVFDSLVVYDRESLGESMQKARLEWSDRNFWFLERTPYPFTLYAYEQPALSLKLAYDKDRLTDAAASAVLDHLSVLMNGIIDNPDTSVADLPLLTSEENDVLINGFNATQTAVPSDSVHRLIEQQAVSSSDTTSLISGGLSIDYAGLQHRANQIANMLQDKGVRKGDIIGVSLDRSIDMVASILGVMKVGAAYLPLDPDYPLERIAFCLSDSGATYLITSGDLAGHLPRGDTDTLCIDDPDLLENLSGSWVSGELSDEDIAYVIYTSGSTGQPKGVKVSHGNVVNFFAGMGQTISVGDRKIWLAVTSLSFDISVLEILWTLSRGFTVVLAGSDESSESRPFRRRGLGYSLFYFASDPGGVGRDKYKLVLEGAKFADKHGFEAVWTPERHFHAFGGLYPNPSVIGAAIAAVTKNLGIRAGSVVLPLHHPLRVVEEWSLVDNLCNGGVGLSVASGWQPNDFVLAPGRYETRREDLFTDVETIRKLWRGESISLENPRGDFVDVKPFPQPVQKELPVWVTAAGSPETFRQAGEIGANLLTHLLGQTVEEIGGKIDIYRQAWKDAGHGGDGGRVTLMLHTFVGVDNEEVREQVREPMKAYLRSAASLVAQYADAWTAYKKGDGSSGPAKKDIEDLSEEEKEDLLDFAFERYFETSALFGTAEKCAKLVDTAHSIGVDEIACLIDFGVDADAVLASLNDLNSLKLITQRRALAKNINISELIKSHNVSHMQCTPSGARSILNEEQHGDALGQLEQMLIGGEAFPEDLWDRLKNVVSGDVINMYGPTETTIWSATCKLSKKSGKVPIGKPIANTQCYVLDEKARPVPQGVPGELHIGGKGVAHGYHNRPELNSDRFVADPFTSDSARMYRTGDIVRWNAGGDLEFLGRIDDQVKIRGFRVELGEVEAQLAGYDEVQQAVVIAHTDSSGVQQLVAYCKVAVPGELPAQSIASFLREKLPDYMVPSQILEIDEFPLTPNMKIDRQRLPDPESLYSSRASRTSREPETKLEESVKQVWESVLGLSDISINDNFFEIGGHSLRAVQVQSELRKILDRKFSITDIFRFPTIESFAGFVGGDVVDTGEQVADRAKRRRAARGKGGRRPNFR